jgi:hypothetical protein
MPYKDKEKRKEYHKAYGKKWRSKNRKRLTLYQRIYRKTHPEYHKKELEYHRKYLQNHPETRLFTKTRAGFGRIRALFELGGCCVFDFKTNPLELEIHHPFGRKKFPDIMIQVCHKHHTMLHHKERVKKYRELRLAEWGKI